MESNKKNLPKKSTPKEPSGSSSRPSSSKGESKQSQRSQTQEYDGNSKHNVQDNHYQSRSQYRDKRPRSDLNKGKFRHNNKFNRNDNLEWNKKSKSYQNKRWDNPNRVPRNVEYVNSRYKRSLGFYHYNRFQIPQYTKNRNHFQNNQNYNSEEFSQNFAEDEYFDNNLGDNFERSYDNNINQNLALDFERRSDSQIIENEGIDDQRPLLVESLTNPTSYQGPKDLCKEKTSLESSVSENKALANEETRAHNIQDQENLTNDQEVAGPIIFSESESSIFFSKDPSHFQISETNSIQNADTTSSKANQDLPLYFGIKEEPLEAEFNLQNCINDNQRPSISVIPISRLIKSEIRDLNITDIIAPTTPSRGKNTVKPNLVKRKKSISNQNNSGSLSASIVQRVASMDKVGIKNVINSSATKYDAALKIQARKRLREEIRKQLKSMNFTPSENSENNVIVPDEIVDSMHIPAFVLDEIRRAFGIVLLEDTMVKESQELEKDSPNKCQPDTTEPATPNTDQCTTTQPSPEKPSNSPDLLSRLKKMEEVKSQAEKRSPNRDTNQPTTKKPLDTVVIIDSSSSSSSSSSECDSDSSSSTSSSNDSNCSSSSSFKRRRRNKRILEANVVGNFEKLILPNLTASQRRRYKEKYSKTTKSSLLYIYTLCINRAKRDGIIDPKERLHLKNNLNSADNSEALNFLMKSILNLFEQQKAKKRKCIEKLTATVETPPSNTTKYSNPVSPANKSNDSPCRRKDSDQGNHQSETVSSAGSVEELRHQSANEDKTPSPSRSLSDGDSPKESNNPSISPSDLKTVINTISDSDPDGVMKSPSSRQWKSPGERKCIEPLPPAPGITSSLGMMQPSFGNFSFDMNSLTPQNTLGNDAASSIREIDSKLMDLHKRKMFIEEMILKLQNDRMEVELWAMKLQNEKFILMNSAGSSSSSFSNTLHSPSIFTSNLGVPSYPSASNFASALNVSNTSLFTNSLGVPNVPSYMVPTETVPITASPPSSPPAVSSSSTIVKSKEESKTKRKDTTASDETPNRKKHCNRETTSESNNETNAKKSKTSKEKPKAKRVTRSSKPKPKSKSKQNTLPDTNLNESKNEDGNTEKEEENSRNCEEIKITIYDKNGKYAKPIKDVKVRLNRDAISEKEFKTTKEDTKKEEKKTNEENTQVKTREELNLKESPKVDYSNIQNGSFDGWKLPITQILVIGEAIVAASEDGNIYKFNIRTRVLESKFSKHTEAITQIYNSPGEVFVYTTSLDGYLKKTSIENFGLEIQSLNLHEPLQSIDIEWGTAFIGSRWGNIFTYDIKSNKRSESILCSSGSSIIAIKATKEGPRKILIVSSKGNVINLRDAMSGLLLRSLNIPENIHIYSILLDGNCIFCGTQRNEIHQFTFTTGTRKAIFQCGNGAVSMKLYKEKYILVGCYDGFVYVLDKNTGSQAARFPGSGKMILALEIAGDKLITSSKDNTMRIIDIPKYIVTKD